jgi:alpha-maltose-1-phosphate synthase
MSELNGRSLRIAVLGTRGIPDVMGGIETHCNSLYPRLVEKGHNVTVFARKGYVPNGPYHCKGVRVEPLWTPKKKSLEAIFHTAYGVAVVALRRKQFDVLHIHGIGPSLMLPFARFLGIKTVMTHHGPDYDRQKWGRFAKFAIRLGERLGCRYSDAVITVSKHVRSTVKELYGSEGNYVPNGVPLPELVAPGQLLARFNLLSKRYILAVGRFVPEKGFHDLLEAYSRIRTDWRLVIAGDTDHEDSYSKSLKERAASDSRVVLTGFIRGRELGEIYSNAGLFVLPSYHEGLPIALLEAMSYDLPIIASDIPANKELIEASETFCAGDVDELQRRLVAFLSEPASSASRRSRIENEFNWDLVSDQTEQVYRKVSSR